MFNTNNNHQLIPRQQTYNLDKKILSIHSEDRDIKKYPFPNNFGIICPETYTNVESIRLVDIAFPSIQDTFNNDYQNTKLAFSLIPQNPYSPLYSALASNVNNYYTLEIQSGFYNSTQLAFELENKLNEAINDYLKTVGTFPEYTKFKVYYNEVSGILYFGNTEDSFTFNCSVRINYDIKQCEQPDMFERYTQWGLPWNLGFEKKDYEATPLLVSAGDKDITVSYTSKSSSEYVWLAAGTSLPSYYIKAPLILKNSIDSAIYMEIDKYNYMDELEPYSQSTSSTFNNDYGGKVNAAFIKIPITPVQTKYFFSYLNLHLYNSGFNTPPIEKLSRLRFRFRYHDGRLVDFKDNPFEFSLEINQIRNEISAPYSIRTPARS